VTLEDRTKHTQTTYAKRKDRESLV